MKTLIYLDHAATTKTHPDVLNAMMPCFCDNFGNASSSYTLGRNAQKAVNYARVQAARLIGASPEEIYFTSGGTEADNWAVKKTAFTYRKEGRHIITSQIEHHAVLHSCKQLEKEGFQVTYLKPDKDGLIDTASVQKAIRPDTTLISIMTANNEVGSLQPIKSIGRLARKNNILFHTDAVQAYGHIPFNVEECMIDMLSVSAHKFNGPKGVGFLYIRKGIELDSFMSGGSQEKGMRAGTYNTAGIVGLGKAADMAARKMHRSMVYTQRLRDYMIRRILKEIPDTILNGHATQRLPGNTSFCFKGIDGAALLLMLDSQGICASAGSACTTGAINPSHVLLAMGIPYDIAKGSLRMTLSEDNTYEEIDKVIDLLKDNISRLRHGFSKNK